MSFYRTYRPQVFDEIDNLAVREQLMLLLNKDRKELPHAYFFTGPKGTGKTTTARLIAKLFNCEKPKKSGPCGTCVMCTSIANGTNIDVLEIDAASNRGIDEIRELRQRIGLTPVSSTYKVYIIDEVHMLTTEAFNALLKTLEEPPVHAVFILATTDPQKVPATILSRCVHISFHRASSEELLHALERIVKDEHITIDKEALLRIAEVADGSFRDAAKLLEQASFHKGTITLPVVNRTLTLSDEKLLSSFLAHLAGRNVKEALADITLCATEGRDTKTFLIDVLGLLERKLVDVATGKDVPQWDGQSLAEAIRRLSVAYGELRISPIPALPLELAVIDFCHSQKPLSQDMPADPSPSVAVKQEAVTSNAPRVPSLGLLTLEKLVEHWPDFIIATKPYNHSVAGVLRSSRPKAVENGIVTIEAFYKFHQEKLSENKVRQELSEVLKKLFGEKVKVEIVLGRK